MGYFTKYLDPHVPNFHLSFSDDRLIFAVRFLPELTIIV